MQARIDAARARLDAAAHELAQLHQQLHAQQPGQEQDTFEIAIPGPGPNQRASLGLLLMPGSRDGVAVAGVTPGGAAAAGIQAGDVLIGLNGANLKEPGAKPPAARVFELLEDVAPGDTVRVDYVRGGETQSADIIAQEPMPMPTMGFAASNVAFAQGQVHHSGSRGRAMIGGLELFDLNETLGHYFGVSDGVLVLNAPAAGDAGGLLAGDIIKTVAGRPVASSADCLNAFSSASNAGEVAVEVLRDGAVVSVQVSGIGGGPALMPFPPQGRRARDANGHADEDRGGRDDEWRRRQRRSALAGRWNGAYLRSAPQHLLFDQRIDLRVGQPKRLVQRRANAHRAVAPVRGVQRRRCETASVR